MPIYTTHGLRIRVDIPTAFGLMARLYPEVKPHQILRTTEALQDLPSCLSTLTAATALAFGISPISIGVACLIGRLAGQIINIAGMYLIPGLVALSHVVTTLAFVVLLVVAYSIAGWKSTAAIVAARLLGGAAGLALDFYVARRQHRLTGMSLAASERHFFNAYRLHAVRLGKTKDLNLVEGELSEVNWKPAFDDFATRYPETATRFSNA